MSPRPDDAAGVIRRVTTTDLEAYRDIRLRALQDAPDAFASTYAGESARPREAWVERVERCAAGDDHTIFLAFDDNGHCVGLAGGTDDEYGADRQLVSMWVEPAARGSTVATDLVDAVVDWMRAAG